MNDVSAKVNCYSKYGHVDDIFPPSANTFFCTAAIIILTIIIEVVAHSYKSSQAQECCRKARTTPDLEPEGTATTTTTATTATSTSNGDSNIRSEDGNTETARAEDGDGNVEQKTKGTPVYKPHHHIASPTHRANRFLINTALLIPLIIAFVWRIQETQKTYTAVCMQALNIPGTQWWAIIIFNIIPFCCACIAWLRTLVDCVLVRWDTDVPSALWPPAWPLTITAAVVLGFGIVSRNIVLWIMGRSDLMDWHEGDRQENGVEMDADLRRNEDVVQDEERGLLRDSEMDDDEVTVYSPRSSQEGKMVSPV